VQAWACFLAYPLQLFGPKSVELLDQKMALPAAVSLIFQANSGRRLRVKGDRLPVVNAGVKCINGAEQREPTAQLEPRADPRRGEARCSFRGAASPSIRTRRCSRNRRGVGLLGKKILFLKRRINLCPSDGIGASAVRIFSLVERLPRI
jgi:hypothetical protein